MSKRKPPLDHYLITMPIKAGHMHCYLMTTNEDDTLKAANKMINFATEQGTMLLEMFVSTQLDEELVEIVRGIIRHRSRPQDLERAEANWARAEDDGFHLTVFQLAPGDPNERVLAEIH